MNLIWRNKQYWIQIISPAGKLSFLYPHCAIASRYCLPRTAETLSFLKKMRLPVLLILLLLSFQLPAQSNKRAADLNIHIGVMQPGKLNAITDVSGVTVGHTTLIKADSVRTGVTVILPHGGNLFQQKVPAAVYTGNGFGKLAGSTQIKELGNIESPIVLTNTLGVATAMNAIVSYTLSLKGNENVQSVNAVVGETNDGYLNDIRGRHIKEQDVLNAIHSAATGKLTEGNVCSGYD